MTEQSLGDGLASLTIADDSFDELCAYRISDEDTRLPQLPPELIDQILEDLRPENWEATRSPLYLDPPWKKRDLLTCSLVSHTWHDIALRHLFRDLVFVVRFPPRGDERQLERSFEDFCSFLHSSPEVRASIRRLRIEGRDKHIYAGKIEDWETFDPYHLGRLLQNLPLLQVLHLCNVYLRKPPLVPLEGRRRVWRPITLKRLHISYMQFTNNLSPAGDLEFTMLLGLFSKVDELHLIGKGLGGDPSRTLQCQRPGRFEVRSLILERGSCGQFMFKHLKNSSCLDAIKCLTVRVVERPHDEHAMLNNSEFVARVGRSVETLRIYLQDNTVPLFTAHGADAMYLRGLGRIRELRIGFTLPLRSELICIGVMHYILRSCGLSYLSKKGYSSLREVIFDITFDFEIPRRNARFFDRRKNWLSECQKSDSLRNLEQLLMEVVYRCELPGIVFECTTKNDSDLDIGDTLSTMFPNLANSKTILARDVRRGAWQTYS